MSQDSTPEGELHRLREELRLLQSVAQAANGELEFEAVLEAVGRALRPFVRTDAIAVSTVEGEHLRVHAIYIDGVERLPGESFEECLGRVMRERWGDAGGEPFPVWPLAGTATEHAGRSRRPYVCQDLASEARFAEDQRLLRFGVSAYVRCPLVVRDRLIGSIAFSRTAPRPFAEAEVATLESVSPLIATAVSNSLAYREIDRLKNRLQVENVALREELDEVGMFEEIVGSSPALRAVLEQCERVAGTDSTVLISGETGTGKEMVARAIHRRSSRAARAMVRVNCASLPESLIGSELFGHEKGAFTGATQRRLGRFELAAGGSIFLDEVGELPAEVQVALLRVLQEREFERVGGTETLRTDARVIAATHRDLPERIEEGTFREDLYYRLNVFPIRVPPLRERKDDIPTLVEYFAARHGARVGKKLRSIDRRTLDLLVDYSWPGNVRELENVIERAVILSDGNQLRVEAGSLGMLNRRAPGSDRDSGAGPGTRSELRSHERSMIERALSQARGRVSGPAGAAARLGMPSTTLESKIRRLGIDKFRFRSAAGGT